MDIYQKRLSDLIGLLDSQMNNTQHEINELKDRRDTISQKLRLKEKELKEVGNLRDDLKYLRDGEHK